MAGIAGEHKGSQMKRTIVVGGGQGAGQLVASLRQEGYDGEIMMIGEEPQLPYQRPPLSKAYLLGELPVERLLVRPEKFYADQNIETRLATKVEAIDTVAQTVTLEGGEALAYSDLVLATGSAVRRLSLPGFDQAGVFYLRTMADVDGIRDALTPGKRLVIIGGGYIAAEMGHVFAGLGSTVTMFNRSERLLSAHDREISERFTSAVAERFHLRLGHLPHRIERRPDGIVVHCGAEEVIVFIVNVCPGCQQAEPPRIGFPVELGEQRAGHRVGI